MKRCTFKGTDEDIARFLDGLPSLLESKTAKVELGLIIECIGRGQKNKFMLAARIGSCIYAMTAMPGYYNITVPALNSLFQEKHDGMLVKACPYMSINAFIDKFGLDKNAVNREVFKALKTKLSAASRHGPSSGAGQFWLACYYDAESKKFTSFYEMVMMASLAS